MSKKQILQIEEEKNHITDFQGHRESYHDWYVLFARDVDVAGVKASLYYYFRNNQMQFACYNGFKYYDNEYDTFRKVLSALTSVYGNGRPLNGRQTWAEGDPMDQDEFYAYHKNNLDEILDISRSIDEISGCIWERDNVNISFFYPNYEVKRCFLFYSNPTFDSSIPEEIETDTTGL